MSYLKLFWSFFQIGLFSFGGGYAALPLIQDQVVTGHHWLTMKEFADVITISQMTPGPIAINSASFVGVRNAIAMSLVIKSPAIGITAVWRIAPPVNTDTSVVPAPMSTRTTPNSRSSCVNTDKLDANGLSIK